MEGIFWVLFFLPAAIIVYVIIAGIVGTIINGSKRTKFVKKYVAEGIINESEKKRLPEILLETAQNELTIGNTDRAFSLLDDCLKLCKINDNTDIEKSASFELARCYVAKGNDEKALGILNSLVTPQAYLLHGELLIKRNKETDCKYAVTYLKKALESEETRDRAQELLEKAEVISDGYDHEHARKRFEKALEFCSKHGNCRVGIARFTTPGSHFTTLKSSLDMYEAIEGYVSEDERKKYGKQLAILALEIADMCCYLGFHESAYAYLESEDFTDIPQADFLYAMLYANTGPEGCYNYGSNYPKAVQDELKKRLKKKSLPDGSYERKLEKAIELAKRAKESGVSEASRFVVTLEFKLEDYRRSEVLRKVQQKWDKQFEEKHGMTRDEYDEYIEERRKAALEQQKIEAEAAAKRTARKKRLERDIDISEMLFDKTHDGTGKTMEEKWKMGEISADDYLEYKNKRDQYVDELE